MYQFHVGDRVYIREDLAQCDRDQWPTINNYMLDLAGKHATIKSGTNNTFRLKELDWNWLVDWLVPEDAYDSDEDIHVQNLNDIL